MTVDMQAFTPWASLLGGILIGLSASVLLLVNGRILGVSGIFSSLFKPTSAPWQWGFVLAVLASSWVYKLMGGELPVLTARPVPVLIAAGLLVGIGTRLGSGCTSGHGVCGLARLSPRSLVATLTFMGAAFLTVFVLRHVL